MLFWMSVIIWHSRQAMVGFIFQDLCFRKGQFEPLLFMKVLLIKKSVYVAQSISVFNSYVPMRPPSGVRASGNWLFFVREFVKMKKIVREFVKTTSFVIHEKKKCRS